MSKIPAEGKEVVRQKHDWARFVWITSMLLLAFFATVQATAVFATMTFKLDRRLSKTGIEIGNALIGFPGTVRRVQIEISSYFSGEPLRLLLPKNQTERPSWQRKFPATEDSGYLLLAGILPGSVSTDAALIRVSDGDTLAKWQPDWNWIESNSEDSVGLIPPRDPLLVMHPLLLSNGDIVFNSGAMLARISHCKATPRWLVNRPVNHSIELSEDGNALWSIETTGNAFPENDWLNSIAVDEALVKYSLEGKQLEFRSFANILKRNQLDFMMFANSGATQTISPDVLHLNEVAVAQSSGPYWQRGDLLISSRHLSSLFIYRPSTDKIIWHRQGPWLNQHSASFVGSSQISVFDNNVVINAPSQFAFRKASDHNRVMIYDFATDSVSEPYAKLLDETRPITITEGRAQILEDGGLFVEETNYGRHLRFTKDKLLWSRVNDYDDTRIGMVSWSRYLTAEQVREPLQAISAKPCNP